MGSVRFIVFYPALRSRGPGPPDDHPSIQPGTHGRRLRCHQRGHGGRTSSCFPGPRCTCSFSSGFFFTRIVVPAFFMLGYWFLQLLGGFFSMGGTGGRVAFWAHVGGFVAGMLFVKPFCNPDRTSACRQRRGELQGLIRRVK